MKICVGANLVFALGEYKIRPYEDIHGKAGL
jgi:hypothetical protein